MSVYGFLGMALLAPAGIVMGWDHSFEPAALCWLALSLAGLVVTAVGTFTLRFEVFGGANQPLQATAAPLGS
jgi:hypothetical protein